LIKTLLPGWMRMEWTPFIYFIE